MIKRYRAIYTDGTKGAWVSGIPGIMDFQNCPGVVGLEWEHAPAKCGAVYPVRVEGYPIKCENTLCNIGEHSMWYETYDAYGNAEYLEITWNDKEAGL